MKTVAARFTPLKVAIFFACIGSLWGAVIFSTMIANLALERNILLSIEVKSVAFILFCSSLLYLFITKTQYEGLVGGREPLTRLVRALKAYGECHQALLRTKDELQLMNNICRIFIEVGGYRMAWVGTAVDDGGKTITPVAGWGEDYDLIHIFKSSCMNDEKELGPIKTAMSTGNPVIIQKKHSDKNYEMCRQHCMKNGFCSAIFLPMSNHGKTFASLVIYSSGQNAFDDDEVTLLTNLVSDLSYRIIALRTEAENKKVEQQRQLLASVLFQMHSGLILLDDQEVIQYMNPAAEKITGCPAASLVGNAIRTLACEESDQRFCETLLNQIASGNRHAVNFQHKRHDGTLLDLELITWTVINGSDAVNSHVGMIRDVTHSIQLENQLRRAQRMEAIGMLAGGIAHDFNNALASIITCTELALDEAGEGSTLKELLDVVHESSYRGKNLVRQILTFSRQTEQERQEVKIDLIANECLKLLRLTVSPTIEICLNIEQGLGFVFADPTQMHQVIMNLCTNAVHAIRCQRYGLIELILENCDLDAHAATHFVGLSPGHYLRLVVRDNGHGMDQSIIERIFDPFFSTKDKAEGTGLGLSVIHGIITKLGGAITVQSTPGQGSKFEVYLPGIKQNQKIAQLDAGTKKVRSGVERILFVDDDPNLIFGAERMLKQLGYHVVTRTDPIQALELFSSDPEQFDLVITDQAMPHMSGMELAASLDMIRPGLPIILCTGYDPTSGYGTDETGQIADYISELVIKPFERYEFTEAVRRALESQADKQVVTNG